MDNEHTGGRRWGFLPILGIVLLTIILSVAASVWFINYYLFPKQFEPVELSAAESLVLDKKLDFFSGFSSRPGGGADTTASDDESGTLEPRAYSEVGADRSVSLSEREINAILARNTDLADKVAIDLADRLISARLRIPMDPDFPMFGGRTLKAHAGVEFSFENERPVVVLKGISVMGVPIPNAWLGNLKNIDLVDEYGRDEGFWKAFADGVQSLEVDDGSLKLVLKE